MHSTPHRRASVSPPRLRPVAPPPPRPCLCLRGRRVGQAQTTAGQLAHADHDQGHGQGNQPSHYQQHRREVSSRRATSGSRAGQSTVTGGPVGVAAAPVAGAPTRRRAPCRNRHGFARRCAVSGLAALWVGLRKYHQGAAGPSQRPTAARRTAVPVARRSPNMLRQPVKRGSSGAAGVGVDRTVASGAQRPHNRFR